MKITVALALAGVLFSTASFAQSANSSASGAVSQSGVNINNPADVTSRTTLRTAPGIAAPGLTSSAVETCINSVSGGGSATGGAFVLGFGFTDKGCEARLDAKITAQLGDVEAGKERLCERPKIRKAYRDSFQATGRGYLCVADRGQAQPQQRSRNTFFASGAAPRTPPSITMSDAERRRGIPAGQTYRLRNDPNTLRKSNGNGTYVVVAAR